MIGLFYWHAIWINIVLTLKTKAMQPLKKNPKKQLEKFSTIFMQIGLVLVLFIVHVFIELETEQKKIGKHERETTTVFEISPEPTIFVKEKKEVKPIEKRKPKQKVDLDNIKKGKNEDPIESVIDPLPEDTPVNTEEFLNTIDEEPEPEVIESFILAAVEKAPIFKGCENLSLEETKMCFEKKLRKFVQKKFNTELADELGLRSGKHRIVSQFVIDQNGDVVDVEIRAPHKTLKIETLQIIKALPQFKPGEHNGKPVKVKYTLPITFRVD